MRQISKDGVVGVGQYLALRRVLCGRGFDVACRSGRHYVRLVLAARDACVEVGRDDAVALRVAQCEVVFQNLFHFVVGELDVVEGVTCFTYFFFKVAFVVISFVDVDTDVWVYFDVTVYIILIF